MTKRDRVVSDIIFIMKINLIFLSTTFDKIILFENFVHKIHLKNIQVSTKCPE